MLKIDRRLSPAAGFYPASQEKQQHLLCLLGTDDWGSVFRIHPGTYITEYIRNVTLCVSLYSSDNG